MVLRVSIDEATQLDEGVWSATLSPADMQVFTRAKSARIGEVSVLGVVDPEFDEAAGILSIDSRKAHSLNAGTSDRALIIDLGETAAQSQTAQGLASAQMSTNAGARGRGDGMFLEECRRHLGQELVSMAERLLADVRDRYPGELHEGRARKWVNHPDNFMALTIQNRDQSFAIHVKGEAHSFSAPSLEVKSDRGSYSRFKLKDDAQLQDAINAVLASARATLGY